MTEEAAVSTSQAYQPLASRVVSRDRFFFGMSVLLLVILLAGFAPTLYLRLLFDVPPIPFYLHIHGAVVTSWFLWLVFQASLVAVHRTDLHRRVGMAGAVIGAAVIPAALMATFGLIPRLPAQGVDVVAEIDFFSAVVWGNFFNLIGFSGFLTVALLNRRRVAVHKRLMLFASLSIMGPALARISYWPVFTWVEEIPFILSSLVLLALLILVHDLMEQRRVHPATAIGGLVFLLLTFGSRLISTTEFAQSFVLGLA